MFVLRYMGLSACLLLGACQLGSNTASSPAANNGPAQRTLQQPPQHRWVPAPDAVYASRHPPAPMLPPAATSTGARAVQHGFVSPGGCLPGFARDAAGTCVFNVANLMAPFGQQPASQSPTPPTQQAPQPPRATVLVEGALLNAKKYGDACWDPFCDQERTRQAFKLAADIASRLDPPDTLYYQAAAVLAPMVTEGWSRPDTYGHASIFSNGGLLTTMELPLAQNKDTLTPQWNIYFQSVPISPNTALNLQLWDADPEWDTNDPIGTVTIAGEELVRAAQVRRTYFVNVARPTNNQVLFVHLSVLPEQ